MVNAEKWGAKVKRQLATA